MNQKLARLSQRYFLAFQRYLKLGSPASLLAVMRLGGELLALGSKTQAIARNRERTLTRLESAGQKMGQAKRGGDFLTPAAPPLGETLGAKRGKKITLNRLGTPAGPRMASDDAGQQNGKNTGERLAESLRLQKHLRQLLQQVLAAQENERKKLSCTLHDEIAQTLLGINVRLLSLKKEVRVNPAGLQKEIASTQQLVVESAESVRCFARTLGIRGETEINRSVTRL